MSIKNISQLLNSILIRSELDSSINLETKVENRVIFPDNFKTWIKAVPEFDHTGVINENYLFVYDNKEVMIDILNERKVEIDDREVEFIVIANKYKYGDIEFIDRFSKDKFDKIPPIEILRLLFIKELIKKTDFLNPKFGFKNAKFKAYLINKANNNYEIFDLDNELSLAKANQIKELTNCFYNYVSV